MKSRVKKVVQNLSRNGRPNWSDYCPRVDEKIAIFVNGILGGKKSILYEFDFLPKSAEEMKNR